MYYLKAFSQREPLLFKEREPCGGTRCNGKCENEYERCGMGTHASGVKYGAVEWLKKKQNIFRWFGNIERMKSEEFVKKVYVIEIVVPNSRGRLLGRWKDRVNEYMCERGTTRRGESEQARWECLHRESWMLFCHGHPFGEHSQREQGITAMGR